MIVSGCNQIASPKNWADAHIGYTLNELYAPDSVKKSAKNYTNSDGGRVVIIPTSPICDIHYILNQDEIVVSYKLVGKDCR
jgi:hypothetical protein